MLARQFIHTFYDRAFYVSFATPSLKGGECCSDDRFRFILIFIDCAFYNLWLIFTNNRNVRMRYFQGGVAADKDVAGGFHGFEQPKPVNPFVAPIDFRMQGPERRAFRGSAMHPADRAILRVDPYFAVDAVLVLALGRYFQPIAGTAFAILPG